MGLEENLTMINTDFVLKFLSSAQTTLQDLNIHGSTVQFAYLRNS